MDGSEVPSGTAGVLPALSAAIAAFIRGSDPGAPYAVVPAGTYRALCACAVEGTSAAAALASPVVLLAAEDGALYAPADASQMLQDTLRTLRLRATTTTLTLRLPEDLAAGPSRLVKLTLWASPAYLASAGASGEVWK